MGITTYVDRLRRDLVAVAEAGDADIKAAAERLVMALGPSARLALMEAIYHADGEITAEMPTGSVDVRLNGRERDIVAQGTIPVHPPPPGPPPAPPTDRPHRDRHRRSHRK